MVTKQKVSKRLRRMIIQKKYQTEEIPNIQCLDQFIILSAAN